MDLNNIKTSKVGNATGAVSLIIFVICMSWGILLATPALKDLHIQLMQVLYPGFSFSLGGVILGLIESFVYGWLIGAGFLWLCKKTCK